MSGKADWKKLTTCPVLRYSKYFNPLHFCSKIYSPFSTFNAFSLLVTSSSELHMNSNPCLHYFCLKSVIYLYEIKKSVVPE